MGEWGVGSGEWGVVLSARESAARTVIPSERSESRDLYSRAVLVALCVEFRGRAVAARAPAATLREHART
jgi:hypothetical protein